MLRRTHVSSPCVIIPIDRHSANAQTAPRHAEAVGLFSERLRIHPQAAISSAYGGFAAGFRNVIRAWHPSRMRERMAGLSKVLHLCMGLTLSAIALDYAEGRVVLVRDHQDPPSCEEFFDGARAASLNIEDARSRLQTTA